MKPIDRAVELRRDTSVRLSARLRYEDWLSDTRAGLPGMRKGLLETRTGLPETRAGLLVTRTGLSDTRLKCVALPYTKFEEHIYIYI